MSEEKVKQPDRKKPCKYPVDGYHTAEKCRGCPYGFKTYCVGLCWKDVYASVINRGRKPIQK